MLSNFLNISFKIRYIVMNREIQEICPSLLTHPGLNTQMHMHMHRVTHIHGDRCHTLERWAANHSTWGAWGYGALLKGTSGVARRWTDTPQSLSGKNGNRIANFPVIGRPTLTPCCTVKILSYGFSESDENKLCVFATERK